MTEMDPVGVRFMAEVRRAEAEPDGPRGANLLTTICTRLLPVGRAAIMVFTGDRAWEMLGASDPIACDWAQAQVAAGEGPGPQSYRTDAPVLVPDFGAALAGGKWPLLAASGFGARGGGVFVFPLHQGAIRVGTLDLYTDRPALLDRESFAAAVQIADVITVVLLAAVRAAQPVPSGGIRLSGNGNGLGPWWEVAASTREIHQATGMVAVQLGVDIATAYARLVAHAMTEGHPIGQLAADIVSRRIRFEPDGTIEPGRARP
ncbi:ANTAR domain-containing protein [Nocardia sp. ET3-3]|uniref:ANTAR domain-containing protein n=1 Tax=Nocardia terrae TaxID=2675851 RepID=A0A7K1UUY7_9NOCA|nr:ANTAR domain-containing protein [Nocardia terrae]MVU78174.1 ANTAR domain-containing protein [Nocardia terrae]